MILRLGDVVCDPTMTEANQGMCSDSAGNLLSTSGVPSSSAPQGGCPAGFVLGPGGAVCIPSNSPAAINPSLPGGNPQQANLLFGVPKNLVYVVGGALVLYMLILRPHR